MATIMWCANHEEMVIVSETEYWHMTYNEYGDFGGCTGPFYTSDPPELPDNWYVLPEPDAEELEVMDQNAELLLFDLGLMEK